MGKRVLRIAVGAAALLVSSVWAQQNVGIGTNTPHPTALLELYSTSKGLLIPRMTQAERDAISSPATGLLIYQTDNTPGFYYWNGTAWIPLLSSSSGSGLFWSLTGNSITGTEFLGTTNAQPLVIRTNNTERMRITATGNVGIGTAAPTERLQVSDGNVAITNTDNTARQLRLYEPSGAGTNFTAFQAQAQGSDIIYTLPASLTPTSAVGAGILQTDASGNLSWLSPTALVTGSAWALTGNAITAAWDGTTGNFLGTTNAQPLVIATTNTTTPQPIQIWVGNQETFRFNPPGASAPAWSIQRGGGNPRGLHAVDLQSARSAPTQVASGDYSVIGGGRDNTASDNYATVGGGQENTASGAAATVGGGSSNAASGNSATVCGGESNIASGQHATVGGGSGNDASGNSATVCGGVSNIASGAVATVGGGTYNIASGDYSAIPGGFYLRVGERSFGFSGQTSNIHTDLSANSNIAAFVDVDLWLYSRDRTQASRLRFYEAQAHGSGANYVALQAPTSLSANTTYTLPADLTTTNTVAIGILQTDASGNLSWLSPAALTAATAWALTGNSITGTEFLGTTNAQPLVIRTNNTEQMRITATGNVGIGTAAPTERLQVSDGNVAITNTDNTARQLRLYEPSGSGTNFTAFRAQAQASDITYTLPASLTPTSAVGAGILQTDASGNLSWLSPTALAAATAWALTGNSITSAWNGSSGNFLGTTNAQPLVIATTDTTTPQPIQIWVGNQETFRFNPPGSSAPAWSIQRGGGNQRGLHAVDLQSARSVATQVASGDYSVIGGGARNTASGHTATVGGGNQNTASGIVATVCGGWENTASGYIATVGGGRGNTANGYIATVGGGRGNTASGAFATVGGGENNIASYWYTTVGGGTADTASGFAATVGGGRENTASGDYATVGGGYQNTASGVYSAIPGGSYLRVGARSFGFSGQTSAAQTDLSADTNIAAFVDVDMWLYSRDRTQASQLRFYEAQAHSSGANYVALRAPTGLSANTTYTLPADLTTTNTVATGILQTDASGNLSWLNPAALGGGGAGWALTGNSITSAWNGTSGNFLGTTNAQPLVIATTNTTTPQPIQIWVGNQETFRFNPPGSSAPAWSIQRGGGNQRGLHAVDLQSARSAATEVASGDYSVIGGGYRNTASGFVATVGGGNLNTASGAFATVGGGHINTASVNHATVGGGFQNTASGNYATVGGGSYNTASGAFATVGGGISDTASGSYATVGGGVGNTASGSYATVGGGSYNTASGIYSAIPGGAFLQVGTRSFGFSGQTSVTQTDLSANSNIAAFVDVDLWLYSRDRTQASQLRFYEAQAHSSGANYVALRAPTGLSANTTYTLPASAPATSAAWLQSDNTGAMSWRPVLYGTVSVNRPAIGANTSTTFTVTITGVQTGDLVFLTPPSDIEPGLVFQGASVTAANTVTIRMRNVTGTAIAASTRTWSYMVIRP
jgi:hypothetical protein